MSDLREQILSRIAAVCAGVSGIVASDRNRLAVTDLRRPAVIVLDGAEQLLDAPDGERRSRVQRMELSPQIAILVRADTGTEAGQLLSLYRGRVAYAVLADATLRDYTGTSGGIRFEGSDVERPDPETREYRLNLNITFTYPFRLTDYASV